MKKSLLGLNLIFLGLFSSFLFTSCGISKKVSKEKKEVIAEVPQAETNENNGPKRKLDKIMIYLGDDSVEKWKLVSLNSQNVAELYDDLPMMRFDEAWKQIYGTTGCNKFTAYYVRDYNLLTLSRLSATELPCAHDESQFLDAMKIVDEIKEEGSILSLLANGKEILIFERL